MESLGEMVHLLRRRRGVTLKALAEEAGISSKALGDIESGRADPKASTLVNLARALDTTPDVLLGFRD